MRTRWRRSVIWLYAQALLPTALVNLAMYIWTEMYVLRCSVLHLTLSPTWDSKARPCRYCTVHTLHTVFLHIAHRGRFKVTSACKHDLANLLSLLNDNAYNNQHIQVYELNHTCKCTQSHSFHNHKPLLNSPKGLVKLFVLRELACVNKY